MSRLLRGHYPSFIAPTNSFANPIWLSSPSASASFKESLQVATSPCCHWIFPTLFLRILPQMPEPIPRRWLSAFAWFFLNLHRPSPRNGWVGFPLCSANTIFHGEFSRFQLFRYVQASEFACLPDRSYRCSYRCRAAETFTSEQNMRRYLRMHRIYFPPDYRQLAERGLSPRQIRSFVGCSHFEHSAFLVASRQGL